MKFIHRVLVTRPEREASHWVEGLITLGFDAWALPLIHIEPPLDEAPLTGAQARLGDYAAVMFVSVNAVRGFWGFKGSLRAADVMDGAREMASLRAWSPGPGTTRALEEAGWPFEAIDAPAADAPQFDSEALWSQVGQQVKAGQRVLIVRGADAQGQVAGREWLAAQLRAEGVIVDEVAAYSRARPILNADQRSLAEAAAADGSVWLFSSSEAIRNLCQLLPASHWSAARAVATHPRIARVARDAGFGNVLQTMPTLEAVAASIKSIL